MNPYPIDNEWAKGHYLARLTGLDDRYGVARDFLRGTPHKGRGVVLYKPEDIGNLPAWIIRAGGECPGCGRPDPKRVELIAADPIGWTVVGEGLSTRDLIALISSNPEPGDDPAAELDAALNPTRTPVYAAAAPEPW